MKYESILLREGDILLNEKTAIPFSQIRCAAVCKGVILCRGGEPDERDLCDILALELTDPIRRGLRAAAQILISLQPGTDLLAVQDSLSSAGITMATETGSTAECQPEAVIVEAKIKPNDYTRAATPGTNAYGRRGLLSPLISAEYEPDARILRIRYLGTNQRDFQSLYFSENPVHSASLADADAIRLVITPHGSRFHTVCEVEFRSIERSDTGSGIWYARMERSFSDAPSSVSWLAAFLPHFNAKTPRQEDHTPDNTAFSESSIELLEALDLLNQNGILTEEEYIAIRSRL